MKKQFIKDIQNIEKLDELKWVFNTTSGINKNNLKEKIINTLKKADGKPIEELKGIDFEKAKKLFNDDLMTEQNYINRILKNLEDDKVFNQIFEIAE